MDEERVDLLRAELRRQLNANKALSEQLTQLKTLFAAASESDKQARSALEEANAKASRLSKTLLEKESILAEIDGKHAREVKALVEQIYDLEEECSKYAEELRKAGEKRAVDLGRGRFIVQNAAADDMEFIESGRPWSCEKLNAELYLLTTAAPELACMELKAMGYAIDGMSSLPRW